MLGDPSLRAQSAIENDVARGTGLVEKSQLGDTAIGQYDVRTAIMKALEQGALPMLLTAMLNPGAIAQQAGQIGNANAGPVPGLANWDNPFAQSMQRGGILGAMFNPSYSVPGNGTSQGYNVTPLGPPPTPIQPSQVPPGTIPFHGTAAPTQSANALSGSPQWTALMSQVAPPQQQQTPQNSYPGGWSPSGMIDEWRTGTAQRYSQGDFAFGGRVYNTTDPSQLDQWLRDVSSGAIAPRNQAEMMIARDMLGTLGGDPSSLQIRALTGLDQARNGDINKIGATYQAYLGDPNSSDWWSNLANEAKAIQGTFSPDQLAGGAQTADLNMLYQNAMSAWMKANPNWLMMDTRDVDAAKKSIADTIGFQPTSYLPS